ncbi:stalk domain-containing protein [Aminipila sp.]|uniref:stalk domain-containing protein n=1 Tax=Aminipila sp. TaxID=2060095 RepID=UPI0028A10B6D|nr:stalk domain-containing protein [Aminipila sp.]
MKRRILFGVIFLSLILSNSVWATTTATTAKVPKFQINNANIDFNTDTGLPYISKDGRAMMPLRACLSSIDCQVDWNQEAQKVSLMKGNIKVEVLINQKYIYVNQKKLVTESAATVQNGRTYLPLRAVMEALGYTVDWDNKTETVIANKLTTSTINGGTTGIFSRKQLNFDGFDGIEGDITLPMVSIAEKGDCPYVYFGLDWDNDIGNVEGGFQFIEDSTHPGYNKWTVFMRQGDSWLNGKDVLLEQGSTHHLKLYAQNVSKDQADIVIELDGSEVVRKVSNRADFSSTCAKAVISMAMSKVFDGTNCFSQSKGAKIENLKTSEVGSDAYIGFDNFELYHKWRPNLGTAGMWFGTVDCIANYLHYGMDGSVSIYK